jgi:hypothetical protein
MAALTVTCGSNAFVWFFSMKPGSGKSADFGQNGTQFYPLRVIANEDKHFPPLSLSRC